MIDPIRFQELAQKMHDTAAAFSETKIIAVRAEGEREAARKQMEDAAAEWRAYVSECALLNELPNALEMA